MIRPLQTDTVKNPRATVDARTTVKVEMSATFYDVGLDNPTIPDDKDAQPARKCASCFG